MNLIEVSRQFGTEEQCYNYLEAVRWPDGVHCPKCNNNHISKFQREGKSGKVQRLYQCLACKKQFTATVGTIFEDTHLDLSKWFLAVALMCDGKKGTSALQLQRNLGCAYRTAWYLAHRIREAMQNGLEAMLTGTVEVDETYVGGKYDKRLKRKRWNKPAVVGTVQRKTEESHSKVRASHFSRVNTWKVMGKSGRMYPLMPES
jgi:transposase-like protein